MLTWWLPGCMMSSHMPMHKSSILITYAQKPIINGHVNVSRGIDLRLHLHPFFMYERSTSTGESVYMRIAGGV